MLSHNQIKPHKPKRYKNRLGDYKKMENKIRFLKNWVDVNGTRVKVWYSMESYTNLPEGTITIYAQDYGRQLPKELTPENDTDSMTDYFEKDRSRIKPDSIYYNDVKKWVRL